MSDDRNTYAVAVGTTVEELMRQVNALVDDDSGWSPVGGVAVLAKGAGVELLQAMTRPRPRLPVTTTVTPLAL